jgi:glycine dehydrogenase
MPTSSLDWLDTFPRRHNGPDSAEIEKMLSVVGFPTLDALIDATVPKSIRLKKPLQLPEAKGEHALLQELRVLSRENVIAKSFIGQGYHGTITPGVILRNVMQNPGWYTAYTPYQAEIAQGRLEALLNYQTMIADLTGLPVANASLLDEGTAAAEAMHMLHAVAPESEGRAFFVSQNAHPQTIAVIQTRALPQKIEVIVGDPRTFDFSKKIFGALLQYPATDGGILDHRAFIEKAHGHGALVALAADPLALCLLTPPGELGADVAIGSTQRFGVPMGFGGPHAAFMATKQEFARSMPGRIIGVSVDAEGKPALRMALQTREQHIRREKATSNICTAQVLLAVMAGMYAAYHGPQGLKDIATRVHSLARALLKALKGAGHKIAHDEIFDTVRVNFDTAQKAEAIFDAAAARGINLRRLNPTALSITFDETSSKDDLAALAEIFGAPAPAVAPMVNELPAWIQRKSAYLTHPHFNRYHSETDMLRYLRSLEAKDFSLTHGMIPLGSCTMKLNATAEMEPVTWSGFGTIHPFAPKQQTRGYQEVFRQLEGMLAEITGFAAVSLMPNAGSQGEYAGLLTIHQYHHKRGQGHRDVCLIPMSAHGTNPATAVMAGYRVVPVKTDTNGNIDVADLKVQAEAHKDKLAALMVTYPSTHGVFEEAITEICDVVHAHGGQVYMDGANMNAQVGLCRPGDFGPDVCHLNLHKTFCIPHGGGGPGMGPICVARHLAEFLPTHPMAEVGGEQGPGPVSAAPWGSSSILLISYVYIALMGSEGLKRATQLAILNANYIAKRLEGAYPTLYRGKNGTVAHECILDPRKLKQSAGIEVEDIAKRLMDYGFHAPTVSFPVAGTLMVEPTESESLPELDRYVEAMLAIRAEIAEVEQGKQPKDNNLLKNAPHTAPVVSADEWKRPYPRSRAAYPTQWTKERKFWPAVSRVNNVHGDRNLVCVCPPMDAYTT